MFIFSIFNYYMHVYIYIYMNVYFSNYLNISYKDIATLNSLCLSKMLFEKNCAGKSQDTREIYIHRYTPPGAIGSIS